MLLAYTIFYVITMGMTIVTLTFITHCSFTWLGP